MSSRKVRHKAKANLNASSSWPEAQVSTTYWPDLLQVLQAPRDTHYEVSYDQSPDFITANPP